MVYAPNEGGCQDAGHSGKMQLKIAKVYVVIQETVSDVSDCLHTMKKLPMGLFMDDPCHFITHELHNNPVEAELCYGRERRGCFESPSEFRKPKVGDIIVESSLTSGSGSLFFRTSSQVLPFLFHCWPIMCPSWNKNRSKMAKRTVKQT